MARIFSCTTPFAIGEIWSNFQVSPKSIAYHPMKHSDRLCPGLGGHGGGEGCRRNILGVSKNRQSETIIGSNLRFQQKTLILKKKIEKNQNTEVRNLFLITFLKRIYQGELILSLKGEK